ncbi:MAG: hypothetical protein GXP27_07810 [Planctomycetes bacterium]|nr:hypothetical protein [Planctomycetota bacterium]
MQKLVVILIGAVLIYKVALAILLVEGAYRLRDGRHERPQPRLAWLLRVFGTALIGFHLLGGLATALAMGSIVAKQWPDAAADKATFALVVEALGLTVLEWLVAVAFCLVGLAMRRTADVIGSTLPPEAETVHRRRLRLMTVAGWGILAVLFLGPVLVAVVWIMSGLLTVFGVFGFLILGGAFIAARIQHDRIEQAQLLWVLAIAAQQGLSLPDEIESYARWLLSPRRLHWRPWRYLAWPVTRLYQRRLFALANDLRRGVPLPDALRTHRGLVPSFAVTAVRAGVATGTLKDTLGEVATRHAQNIRLSTLSPLASFVLYVYMLITVMTAVVMFQMYYIAPKFKKIFMDYGVEPPLTAGLFRFTDFVTRYFVLFVAGGVLIVAGLLIFSRMAASRRFRSGRKTKWLSRWLARKDTPEILRALARFIRKSRSLVDGLTVLAERCFGPATRTRLERARQAIAGGEGCWTALQQVGLIDSQERSLLQAAERAGNLSWALDETAARIEQHRQYWLAWWLELIRPAVTIALGVAVAWVCLGFFLGLIQLLSEVSRW